MSSWIIYLSGLFFLSIASYSDLKKRIVDDYIPYTMIGLGLFLRLYFSILDKNYSYIITGLISGLVFFIIGASIYYLNGWGGADAKMLSAIGVAIGWHTLYFLVILCIISIPVYIYMKSKKEETMAFIPYFLIAYILTLIIIYFGLYKFI